MNNPKDPSREELEAQVRALQEELRGYRNATQQYSQSNGELCPHHASSLLETVAEETEAMVAAVDKNFRYCYFNRAYWEEMRRLTGKGISIGMSVTEVVADIPEQHKIALEKWQQALVGEDSTCKIELGDPSRYLRIYRVYRSQPLWDAAGAIVGAGQVAHEITDQSGVHEVLLKRVILQEYLVKIAATVPGMIYAFRLRPDGSTCMPYASPNILELHGLTPEDVREDASPVLSLIHPDDHARVGEKIAASARDLSPFHEEWRVRHPHKGQIWLEVSSVPERERDGGTLWHGFVQDVTARKEAELELVALKDHLATLVDAMMSLHEISTRFIQEDNVQSLLEQALSAAIEISEADMGNIQILEGASNSLEIVAQQGFEQPFLDFFNRVESGHGCCGNAMQQGKRILVEDVRHSPIFSGTPALDILLEAGVQAVQSTPLFARSGRLVGMLSTHYRAPRRLDERKLRMLDLLARQLADLIERFRAAEVLRESQADLNRAQSLGQIGSWRLDVRRNHLAWSAENHRIFGIPPGTMMTYETFLSAVHPEDRAYVDQQWQAGLRGEPYDIEHRLLVDGQVKWVRERAELEFDTAGQVIGGFGTTQDITERKLAEHALRYSEARFHSLFESSPVPLWEEDFSAVKRCLAVLRTTSDISLRDYLAAHPEEIARLASLVRILDVNQACVQFLGAASKAEVWKPLPDYLDERSLPIFADQIAALAEGATQWSGEGWHKTDGGDVFVIVRLSIAPGHENSWSRVFVSFTDITAQRHQEAERIAQMARQRDALVREVHHRIKNHLQGVTGLLRNRMANQPKLLKPLSEVIGQIRAIAEVYGLQSRATDASIRLDQLLETIIRGASWLVPFDYLPPGPEFPVNYFLAPEENVSLALVINELLTNATKHNRPDRSSGTVAVALEACAAGVKIRIRNGPSRLPYGFDFLAGIGIGTGLALIRSLLPSSGANLLFRQEGETVVTELVLASPVIQTDLAAP